MNATFLKKIGIMTAIVGLASLQAFAGALPVISGCTAEKFVSGARTNEIGTTGASYTPNCLKVKVGATVTIKASNFHPLSAMPDIEGKQNPFADFKIFVATQTRTMDRVGLFGYFCANHGSDKGLGMAGVILVEE